MCVARSRATTEKWIWQDFRQLARPDRRVVVRQCVGRPADRPPGQHRAPRGQLVGRGEHPDRAASVGATPGPLGPDDQDRASERWGVMDPMLPASVADRDDPQAGHPVRSWSVSTRSTSCPPSSWQTPRTCMPGALKLASARADQRTPAPHLQSDTSRSSENRLRGRCWSRRHRPLYPHSTTPTRPRPQPRVDPTSPRTSRPAAASSVRPQPGYLRSRG